MARHLLLALLLLAACSPEKREFGTVSPLETQSTSAGSATSTAPGGGVRPNGSATGSGGQGPGATSDSGGNPGPDGATSTELDASVGSEDTGSNPGAPESDAEPNTEASSASSAEPSTDPNMGPPLASNGETCGGAAACGSNYCVDGVCCDTACDGVCASCNQNGNLGTCQATASDTACAPLTNKKALGESCSDKAECGSNFCVKSTEGGLVCSDSACDTKCQVSTPAGHCTAFPADDVLCGTIDCPTSTSCTTYPADVTSNRCASFGNCVTPAAVCPATQLGDGADCGGGQTCDGNGTCRLVCPTTSGAGRACSAQCPCTAGQGVCTADNQCGSGLVCGADAALKFGFTGKTCIAAHCNNNTKDGTETSVDCGGECGCSATFEVLTFSGVPSGAIGPDLGVLSGDGSRLVGYVRRGQTPYTVSVSRAGQVTELGNPDAETPGSYPIALSTDGNTVLGASFNGSYYKWVGSAAPAYVFAPTNGSIRDMSASGSIFVGDASSQGFRTNSTGVSNTTIPQLIQVRGVSSDGLYVLGNTSATQIGVWSSSSLQVAAITRAAWTSVTAQDIAGTAPFAVGYGNLSDANSTSVGFRWKGGSSPALIDLPALSGLSSTRPNAVTPDGNTIVGYALNDNGVDQSAIIWTDTGGNGTTRTLLTELKNRGLELPVDTQAEDAALVSDDGKVIIGSVRGSPMVYWRVIFTN